MPDYVKIDRMLLSGIQDNPQKQHFVKSIVKFAHENDILVLSEGVETSAELRTCIELGTDFVQGYYTARPCEKIVSEIAPEVREEIFMYATRFFPDQVS
jgi:EAL domain-containing protein (putative c-di-GMP-specific phosphodiesterase class I)